MVDTGRYPSPIQKGKMHPWQKVAYALDPFKWGPFVMASEGKAVLRDIAVSEAGQPGGGPFGVAQV